MEQEGDEGRDGERPECLERCPFLAWQKKLGPMISELRDTFDAYIKEAEERERAVMVGPDQSALLAAFKKFVEGEKERREAEERGG
jgi:hypothetical protein